MSHDIDTSTGTAAVFSAGDVPWHRLGRNVEGTTDSRQAIALAGLDWHVSQRPLHASSPDGWGRSRPRASSVTSATTPRRSSAW